MVGTKLKSLRGAHAPLSTLLLFVEWRDPPNDDAGVLGCAPIYRCLDRSLTAREIRSGTIALAAIQASANDSAPCENTTTFTVA